MKPRHFAIFLPDLGQGGAERMMANLSRGLFERGHRVDLVLCRKEGVYFDAIPPEVRIFDLGVGNPMLATKALVAYLEAEKPETMLSALNQPNTVAVWALAKSRHKPRVVIGIRNTLTEEAKHAKSLKLKVMPLFVKRYGPRADAVIAVSQGAADDFVQLTGMPASRVHVVYNPVIDDALLAGAKVRPEHPWFQEGQPPVVLGIGRLNTQKDFPTLLKAFAKVRAQRECRLMILGEGPDREALQAEAQALGFAADFQMPGFVSPPFGYMAHAGVFVLSSLFEGLPGVLIQALASGAPCVATDCPSGPREVLDGGRIGALIPMSDPVAMAAAISKALDGQLVEASTQDLQRFTMEAAVSGYEQVMTEGLP
ncbi:MAG: glycosyltransferase [Armatimonadetes bacterium]|nr:glycosyltransferase [Armatimonadota bacterium]